MKEEYELLISPETILDLGFREAEKDAKNT